MPALRTITTAAAIHAEISAQRAAGRSIGLVPTMGALHEGHLSLVRRARAECDAVVATIFVNPTQFGPSEDFSRYPRTLEKDLELLAELGCDLVFAPAQDEIYPPGFSTYVEPPAVAALLEGKHRPGHFRGVGTVVLKLFNLISADVAYFGQKDYQQSLVIQHMVRDLNLPIQITICPILRESDGLALSSRNRYLSPTERQQALALSRSLRQAEELVRSGLREARAIAAALRNELAAAGIQRIDYATVADAQTLAELNTLDRPAVALVACHVGTTRLIDNCLLPLP
ncbi:MAG TPA: pantoate--beta-alanine ligase [Pirellulaceae bacterium]|nr:pantoate--beta-alanine ligase [Pirellulaceae bacterium]